MAITITMIVGGMALIGCHGSTRTMPVANHSQVRPSQDKKRLIVPARTMPLANHSQVRPSQDRKRLIVFDCDRLRSVGPDGQTVILATYSPRLAEDIPLSYASGDDRHYLATDSRVFDVSKNPPRVVTEEEIDSWAYSPMSVFGKDQSLAFISGHGTVFAQNRKTKIRDAIGVYSSADSDYLYVTTYETLIAYDVKTKSVVGKLPVGGEKVLAVVNAGNDVLLAHSVVDAGNDVLLARSTYVLSIFDRNLSKSKFEWRFNEHQEIWSLDLFGDHLAVVTWEGRAFSAKWVLRLIDVTSRKEVKTIEYSQPITCYVMQGDQIAVVGESGLRWENW